MRNAVYAAAAVTILTGALFGASSDAVAEEWWERISLSGFSSAVYRKTDSEVQFQPHVEDEGAMGSPVTLPKFDQGITDEGSMRGTKYALNIRAELSDTITIASQFLASQQEHDYSTRLDWAFTSFQLSDNTTFRFGKIKYPVGLVNEYVDVGVTYPWIEAPAVIYSEDQVGAQATREAYSGASLLMNAETEEWEFSADLFTGQVDITGMSVKRLLGATLKANWDDTVQLQASYTNGDMFLEESNPMFDMMNGGKHTAVFLGVKLDWEDVLFFYEAASVEMDAVLMGSPTDMMNTDSWYASIGYRMDDWMPHFTVQNMQQGDGDENTISTLGLRWDVAASVAVKFEYSVIDVTVGSMGIFRGGLFGVESDADPGVAGGTLILPDDKVEMIGVAVDVVF